MNPSIRKTRKTQRDGQKSGGQNITVYIWSSAPSHTQTLSNPFRTLAIKWEVVIFVKNSSCVFIIASVCILHDTQGRIQQEFNVQQHIRWIVESFSLSRATVGLFHSPGRLDLSFKLILENVYFSCVPSILSTY